MTSVTTSRRQGLNSSAAVKVACKAATTAAITRSGEQTIDGVSCVTGDRVLVKDQSSGVENGIYVVDTGAWERDRDFDGYYDVKKGTLVFVHSGSMNQGWWYVSTSDTITVGTTAISFTRSSTALAVISAFAQTLIDDTTAAAARTTLGIGREIYVDDYAVGDGSTDDTAAIQAAFDALAAYQTLVFSGSKYKTNGCITVTADNIGIRFENTTLLMGDTGANGTLTNDAQGKIGLLFKEAGNLTITGTVRCFGQGTPGSTSLSGMVFDQCDNAKVPALMYFENMAGGRFIQWCDTSAFGDVYGKGMDGLQTFESPPTNTQGSVEVVVGCKYTTFGMAVGHNNLKPVRYLSVAYDADSNAIDTAFCRFGGTIGEAASDTDETSVLAIRSAEDCTFGPVHGDGMSRGVQFTQFTGDDDFSCTRNHVEAVTGVYVSTAASVDAAVYQDSQSAVAMGSNSVGKVSVTAAGEFGIYCGAGDFTIFDALVTGGTRPVTGQNCTLNFGRLAVADSAQEAITIGKACNFVADFIDISSGSSGGVSGAIVYNTSFGTGSIGSISIGRVKYRHNSSGTNFQYVVLDTVNGFESWNIGHIDGTGSVGQARFTVDDFSILGSRILSTAVPSTGTYTRGSLIWKSDVAGGGSPGWVCVTGSSTGGTWKTLAAVST